MIQKYLQKKILAICCNVLCTEIINIPNSLYIEMKLSENQGWSGYRIVGLDTGYPASLDIHPIPDIPICVTYCFSYVNLAPYSDQYGPNMLLKLVRMVVKRKWQALSYNIYLIPKNEVFIAHFVQFYKNEKYISGYVCIFSPLQPCSLPSSYFKLTGYYHRCSSTRSTPYKGTDIAGMTSKWR